MLCESFVAINRRASRRRLADASGAAWINVKRPFRRDALNAVSLVQHFDDQIAAAFEMRIVLGNKFLRAGQASRRPLADAGRVRESIVLDLVIALMALVDLPV